MHMEIYHPNKRRVRLMAGTIDNQMHGHFGDYSVTSVNYTSVKMVRR